MIGDKEERHSRLRLECGICQDQPEGSPDLMCGGREGEEGNRWEIR